MPSSVASALPESGAHLDAPISERCQNFSFAKTAADGKVSGMSVEQLEQSVLSLKKEDRRRFLDWLCDHEEELLAADDIHPEVQAEILRRRDEAIAHPELMENWNTAFPRIKQRFDELRHKNPFAS